MIRSVASTTKSLSARFAALLATALGSVLVGSAAGCVVVADGPGGDGGDGSDGAGEGEGEGEGEPVEALPVDDAAWTYTTVEGAACGNGDPVGVATNRGTSSRLVIYLEGGGACWDAFTCGNGFATYVDTGVPASVIGQVTQLDVGIFARGAASNPFAADSFAYVPYCTGDVHSGTRVATPWGVRHVGHTNLLAMLPRILATFPDVDAVVLTGTSAGGYGGIYNAGLLKSLLPPSTTLAVLHDSSAPLPPFPGAEAAAAAQVAAWEPPLCADCTTVEALFDDNVTALPDVRFGLIQSNADPTLRYFYSPDGQQLPAATWDTALDAWVAARSNVANLRLFITGEERHVYVYDRDLAATVVDGVALASFMAGVVGDDAFVSAITP
jgi:hypothetical protein